MPPTAPPPKISVLPAVLSKLFSILILAALSLIVSSYRRTLEPLYGFGPTDHHFTKISWASCILGSFAPTLPILPATLAAGVLICLMPQSAYWVAVYTGRAGDPIWGPVVTHVVVILPILYLGVALVKALQERSAADSQDSASAGQQLITLPICQTSITALQELWSAFRPITQTSPSHIILLLGALTLAIWTIAPFLPSIFSPPAPPAPAPTTPVQNDPAKPKSLRKRGAVPKPVPLSAPKPAALSAPTPDLTFAFAKKLKLNLLRLGMLPLLPVLLTTVLQPPTLRTPLQQPYTHPSYPLRILSSAHSAFSGVVVVGEVPLHEPNETAAPGAPFTLRYLRAGHSLLGGVWIGKLAGPTALLPRDGAGVPLGDSIYSAFVLQEAARLVVRAEPRERESALMIGLGTGISAAAFMRHGLDTTIVELDPIVYNATRRFFGLPEPAPNRLVLRDARGWVRERRDALVAGTEQALFDIVVHDVFSGGSAPGHLFTQQFWEDVKAVMRVDGVVAVNHVEKLSADSSRAILLTLESVFGPCRAFSDASELSEAHGPSADEPLNWVFFCLASAVLPTFRPPTEADCLGSQLRWNVFSTLPVREADLAPIRAVPEKAQGQYILRDEANALMRWTAPQTIQHWKMMRQVFPGVVWETY